jgi:hypothetical protein
MGGGLGTEPISYCAVCTLDHTITGFDLDAGTSGPAKAYVGVFVEDDMVAIPNDHPLASSSLFIPSFSITSIIITRSLFSLPIYIFIFYHKRYKIKPFSSCQITFPLEFS